MNVKTHPRLEILAIAAMLMILPLIAGCEPPRARYGIEPEHIDSSNFLAIVQNSNQPVFIDVWMENCGPCREMAPLIEDLAADFKGQAIVAKLNGDENPELVDSLGVRYYPTVIIYKDGDIQYYEHGYHSKGRLTRALKPLIDKPAVQVAVE